MFGFLSGNYQTFNNAVADVTHNSIFKAVKGRTLFGRKAIDAKSMKRGHWFEKKTHAQHL